MRMSDWSSDVCSSDRCPGPSGRRGRGWVPDSWPDASTACRGLNAPGPSLRVPAAMSPPLEKCNDSRQGHRSQRVLGKKRGGRRAPRPEEDVRDGEGRSEENTSELQSLMRSTYVDFCLNKKTKHKSSTSTKTVE